MSNIGILIILTLAVVACNSGDNKTVEKSYLDEMASVDHPNDFTTPNGHEIKYVVNDSNYYIQWKQAGTLKTLDRAFYFVEGGNSSFPHFVSENENYIVLRNGCGSPCWNGFFLPLYKGGVPEEINVFIAFDLDAELVASVSSGDGIRILNLRTSQKQYFNPGNCESAFLGWCIDTAYFKDNTLHYTWTPETYINSNANANREYTIKNIWH